MQRGQRQLLTVMAVAVVMLVLMVLLVHMLVDGRMIDGLLLDVDAACLSGGGEGN